MNVFLNILIFIIGLFIGVVIPLLFKKKIFAGEYEKVESLREELIEKNNIEFENRKKKMSIDLKEEFSNWKNEYNKKQSHKANRLNEMERRLIQREENLDRRYINLDNKEKEIKKKDKDLLYQEEELCVLKTKG